MIKNRIKFWFFLFLLWFLLSGKLEAKFIIIGIVTSLIISVLCYPLTCFKGANGKSYSLMDLSLLKTTGYFLWLIGQIILSSLSVARRLLMRNIEIEPQVIRFKYEYNNPVATSILINSIILTPGTVTIDYSEDGVYTVHALTDSAANGLLFGDMQRKIKAVFDCT